MMPKKKDNIEMVDDGVSIEDTATEPNPLTDSQPFTLPDPVAETTPSLIGKSTEVQLRKGYVFIKKIGKDSIIQVAAKQVGTVFKTDEWEVLSEKKK